ncbi:unnamed protein product [Symbiodinium sp. KB8]|nr:unnamed protein product [Symbiodinium sp. KB8]
MASKDIEIRNAVAAKCLDEVIVNGTLGMAVGAAAALTLVSKGRPFLRGLVAGISTGVGLGISYVHADERYLAAQAAQVEGLPANKR